MFHSLILNRVLREPDTGVRSKTFLNPGTYKLILPQGINVIWVDGCGAGGGGGGGSAGAGAGGGGGGSLSAHTLPVWLPSHTGDATIYVIIPSGALGGNGGASGVAGADGADGLPLLFRYNTTSGVIFLKLEGGNGGKGAPIGGAGGASGPPNTAYSSLATGGLAANGAGTWGGNPGFYVQGMGAAGCIIPGAMGAGGGGWNGTGTGGSGGYNAYVHVGSGNNGNIAGSTLGATGGTGGLSFCRLSGISANHGIGGPPLGSATAETNPFTNIISNTPTVPFYQSSISVFSNCQSPGGGGGGGGTGVAGGKGGNAWCRISW